MNNNCEVSGLYHTLHLAKKYNELFPKEGKGKKESKKEPKVKEQPKKKEPKKKEAEPENDEEEAPPTEPAKKFVDPYADLPKR